MSVDAIKLTSYFGERHRTGGRFTADALIDLYGQHEIAASILLRGTEGFGLKHHLRTDRSLTLSEDLPLTAIAVDSRSRIETVLGPTLELNRTGLVTLERARLLSGEAGLAGQAALPPVPGDLPGDPAGPGKLTVYLGRQERIYRVPAFVAVCDLLHRRGVDGATALLGVDGTAHGRRERARFFSRNAEVPMMVMAVGSGARIAQVLPELGALLRRPLATIERVQVCKRDGSSSARPIRCRAPTNTAWRSGASSRCSAPNRPSTLASRCTVPSSGGCAPPGSAARPRSAGSGGSTATTRRTATGSSSWAGTCPPSRS